MKMMTIEGNLVTNGESDVEVADALMMLFKSKGWTWNGSVWETKADEKLK